MSNRKKQILVLFLFLLPLPFLELAGPGANSAEPVAMPAYGAPGPHTVGLQQLEPADGPPLALTIWYPAEPAGQASPGFTYRYPIKLSDTLNNVKIASYRGLAREGATPASAAGPYPLVILSPGFAIGSSAYAWLGEQLASYGFVVIAPEHEEHLDPANELWRAAISRPQAVQAVMAYLKTHSFSSTPLASLIDYERSAVVGHSYGGYTALAAAGARIDTASLTGRCQQEIDRNEPGKWLCEMLLPRVPDMAATAGLGQVPAGLWTDWSDPDVDAVVSLAGDAFFFGEPGLAELTVPLLAIGGTLDEDSPFNLGPGLAYDQAASTNKSLVMLHDAEHMVFTNPCTRIPLYARPLAAEFCNDTVWERPAAQALISHFTTAFLLAALKSDSSAAAYLAPDTVDFAGITYQAEGY